MTFSHMKELVLASKSPRRQELLEKLGLPFRVQSPPTIRCHLYPRQCGIVGLPNYCNPLVCHIVQIVTMCYPYGLLPYVSTKR